MLIYKGKLKAENLRKGHLSRAEWNVAAREHGLRDLKKIDLTVLEVDGNISMHTQDFKNQHKTHRSKINASSTKELFGY